MIFSACVLFAQEAPKEEPKAVETLPETSTQEEPKNAETSQETPQNAETLPETSAQEEPKNAETSQETPQNVETLPETSAQEEPKNMEQAEQQPDTAAELDKQAEESHAAVADEIPVAGRPQKTDYYRPYLGVGVPLVVLGSLSVVILMPAMGAMAFAASDGCKDKDWDFCEQCRNDHHTAWTTGAVLTGVLGAGMIVTGSWLITVQKPRENQYVRLNNVAVVPTKKGMMASVGFNF